MHQPWIDGHLDLACISVEGRAIHEACSDPATGCISMPDLAASPIRLVFGTIFTAPAATPDSEDPCEYISPEQAFTRGTEQLQVYERLESEGLAVIQHGGIELPGENEPLGIRILMEGADPIRSPEDAQWWHERGLRLVGLTWSRGTRYAGGNAQDSGLTSEGRELVAALDELGIVHDASHLSDASLDDLLDCASGRIVATHSNSRAILGGDNQRHLRDDHASEILRRGGVIGLNLFGIFLARERRATIADCVEHVMHFCELAGNRRQVALGSDYDGGFTPMQLPEGLEHPRDLPKLLEALATSGFEPDDLAAFAHGNWVAALDEQS